jgi:hypothetical protein
MGIYFEHSAEHNFMLIVLHGAITNDEVNAHINRLLSGEYTAPGTRGLMVLCKNISTQQLGWRTVFDSGMRMRAAKFRQSGKLAIVAESSLAYGLARIYQTATDSREIDETRVLRREEMDEAIAWLDIHTLAPHINTRVQACETPQSEEPKRAVPPPE